VNCFGINEWLGTVIPPHLITIFDRNDGYYDIEIWPDESGIYAIYVLINGKQVGGCPYLLEVTPGSAHPKFSVANYLAFIPL